MASVLRLANAQGQDATIIVLKADFVRTRVMKTAGLPPTVLEEGSYAIAADGRYRIDRLTDSVKTAEIVDIRSNTHIALDFATKSATVGPRSPRRLVPFAQPTLFATDTRREDLGKKNVGDMTLQGVKQVFVMAGAGRQIIHTWEIWDYRFPEPADPSRPPIILEERFEDENQIEERRVTVAFTTQVSERATFAAPADFTIDANR